MGPITDQGKLASSLNAVTHELTAQTVVLYDESQDQYQAELDEYLAYFQPQGKPEFDLVRQLAATHWRLCRYASVESGILEHQMDKKRESLGKKYGDIPPHHRLAMVFETQTGANSSLSLLNRYEARLHREYRETLRLLERRQANRLAPNTELPNERQQHT